MVYLMLLDFHDFYDFYDFYACYGGSVSYVEERRVRDVLAPLLEPKLKWYFKLGA